jgi:hypothetical protein
VSLVGGLRVYEFRVNRAEGFTTQGSTLTFMYRIEGVGFRI